MTDSLNSPGNAPLAAAAPRRLRFSLLTLLLLLTIAALAVALWQLNAELAPLRAENKRLREEAGELIIEDRAWLHAVQAPKPDALTWKWRLWVPDVPQYQVCVLGGRVPATGFPATYGRIGPLKSGESTITYRILKDPKTDAWRGSLSHDGSTIGSHQHDWVNWKHSSATTETVGAFTARVEPNKTLRLTRHQVYDNDKDPTQAANPAAGFLVWIEPMP